MDSKMQAVLALWHQKQQSVQAQAVNTEKVPLSDLISEFWLPMHIAEAGGIC